jgi:cardiolipin synthase
MTRTAPGQDESSCAATSMKVFEFLVMRAFLMVFVVVSAGCGSLQRGHQSETRQSKGMDIPFATGAKIVLRSTVLATAEAPLASTRAGVRMCYDRTYSFLRGTLPATPLKTRGDGKMLPRPGEEAFEALLDHEGLPERSAGSVQYLVDGPAFFPAFYRSIEGAKERVDVQFYIFDNDKVALDAANLLKRKSYEVPVRLLIDPIGSEAAATKGQASISDPKFKSLGDLISYLKRDSRVKVRTTTNPWSVSDHTKLVVIDGSAAFIGGMNIGAEYLHPWHDMMVRLEGPIVEPMSRVFEDHWKREDWQRQWGLRGWFERKRIDPQAVPANGKHPPLRMLRTDTLLGKREVLKATLAAIRCARQRIWIETPYFAVDEITAEVVRAARRGVDVRIIFPGVTDSEIMQNVNLVELRSVLKIGAKVYEYPGMTHLKATVCDGWATFGSANYDTLSMRINGELNVATSDPATVQKLIDMVFEPDFRMSPRLTLKRAMSRGSVLTEIIGDQL